MSGATGATGAAGATGSTGATGATGTEGKAGTNLAGEIGFSTGGGNLANKEFVGLGASNTSEGKVQQIISVTAHVTAMRCYAEKAPGAAAVFTLRDNASATAATCTIASGVNSGSTTGLNVEIKAGDLLDVATPAAGTSNSPGSFSVAIGP